MYGLVNRAVRDLIVSRFGESCWLEIARRAGVAQTAFLSMTAYPDEVTYRLVDAASEVTGLPGDAIFEAFGEHWTLYTAREGYGEMLKLAGRTLFEFLQNLDTLHARVGLLFPELAPPSFRCADVTDRSMRLEYYSNRPGLAPFVVGLVKGLGKRFDTPVSIELVRGRADGLDHDEFLVQLPDPAD